MVFSSFIFLWVFLPLTLLIYFSSREKFYNIILFITSLLFYAWGEPFYVLVMLASIIFNYLAGRAVGQSARRAKLFLTLGILGNLGLLGYYKYADFFVHNINAALRMDIPLPGVLLPIGISFYTFQSISYLVDIYRGETPPQKNIIKMGLFIALFPQLIAGPIVKYHDINRQIDKRRLTINKFNKGVYLFIIGLSKKILIANTAAAVVDHIFDLPGAEYGAATAWLGALAYTVQIYFDFSGYSDMAIGLSKMFGFEIKENFNYPYISQSIREFWRRWHISLSTWFKEYVYIPLGGNRAGAGRTYINLLIVFFLTGLWHGAEWTFVIWGMYHGAFLILERVLPVEKVLKWGWARNLYAMFVVICGWVIFRAESLSAAWETLKKMFSFTPSSEFWVHATNEFIVIFIAALLACGFVQKLHWRALASRVYSKTFSFFKPVFLCACFFTCILYMANNTYNPFIYFRF